MSALDATVIAAVDDLELAARLIVEGLRAGGHRSPFHGFSAEFQQHRPYRAGDDIKYLDWKILARTDRLYSRQFRESTSMSVMIVLDSSASMAFPESGVSKFHYARVVAASLAYLAATQGDAVGLITVERGQLAYIPARGGRPHLRSLIARLDNLAPAGTWEPDRLISRGAELLKRRGVLFVLSDFYDAEDETRRALRRVAHIGHDVGMLQILARDEMELRARGEIEFEDLESGERRLVASSAVEKEYAGGMNAFLERCRTLAHRDGVDYALLPTDEAPERTIRNFLLRRNAEERSGGIHAAQEAAR